MTRTWEELDNELAGIRINLPAGKCVTVSTALTYGIRMQKTPQALERLLLEAEDILQVVNEIANMWDGQDYISGALVAAKQWMKEQLQ